MDERSLRRHKTNHPNRDLATLTRSRNSTAARVGKDMGDELVALLDRTETLLEVAEETGSISAALACIRELRGLWELFGKATGALKERHEVVVVNLVQTDEWLSLADELFTVLHRYPDALVAVQDALRLREPAA